MAFGVIFLSVIGLLATVIGTADTLSLAKGQSRVVRIVGIRRAAVADSKILKVKPIPPNELLLIGKKTGTTNIICWTNEGEKTEHTVRILDSKAGQFLDKMVHISLQLLEWGASGKDQLGIRWPESLRFSFGGGWAGSKRTSSVNMTGVFSSAEGFLSFLIQEGWATQIAQPELYVRLGQQAVFHSGGEFPVATSRASYGRHFAHVDWKAFGLTIRVTPSSYNGLYFASDIALEIVEPSTVVTSSGVPSFSRQKLLTKLDSQDGATVVLSGLKKNRLQSSRSSVAGLSSVPLLGSLFTQQTKQSREVQMLMAITLRFASSDSSNRVKKMNEQILEKRGGS